MRILLLLLAAVLAAASQTQTALAVPPARVEIRFEIVTGRMKLGEGRHILEHDGDRYQVINESTPTGIAALFIKDVHSVSRGRITNAGLKPDSYVESGRKGGRREASFDWPQHRLTMAYDGEQTIEALPPDTLDAASFPYGFAFDAPTSEKFTVHITDGKKLKEYEYRLVGRETLSTPMGDLNTMHFEKVRDADDKRGFEFWLAIERHFLPVRLRYIEKNGRLFDSNVVAIQYQ